MGPPGSEVRPNFYLRGLQAVAGFTVRHPALILALGVVCVVAASFYSSAHMRMNSDHSKLVRQDAPFRQAYEDYLDTFPQFRDMSIVVLDGDSVGTLEDAQADLAAVMRTRSDVAASVYAPGAGDWYEDHAFLYLDVDELERVAARLAEAQPALTALTLDPSLRGLLDELRSGVERLGEEGEIPSGFDIMAERVATVAQSLNAGAPREISWSDELFDPSGRVYRLVILQSRQDYGEAVPAERLIEAVQVESAKLGLTPESGVRVRLTGFVPLGHGEMISARDGVLLSSVIAVIMLLVILGFGLRSLRIILATLAALVLSLTTTTAWAMATVGEFNVVSAAFAVLLIGLGVDFGIHIGLRYEEELAAGANVEEALRGAVAHTGAPISLCTLTSAIGFASFIPTEYRGLAALGIIAGGGMFTSLIASYTVLPAVLALTKPKASRLQAGQGALSGLSGLVERRAVPIVLVTALLAVAAIALSTRSAFDFSTLSLKDPSSESMLALADLEAEEIVTDYSVSVIAADVPAAESVAEELLELDVVSKVQPPSEHVPEDQDEKLAVLEEASFFLEPVLYPEPSVDPPTDLQRVESVRALIEAVDELPADVDPGARVAAHALADSLRPLLQSADPVGLARTLDGLVIADLPDRLEWLKRALEVGPVEFVDLPDEMQDRLIAEDGRALVVALPEDDVSDVVALKRFVEAVQAVAPTATGRPVVEAGIGEIVTSSFQLAIGIAVLAILSILLVTLRRLDDAVIVLAPIVLAAFFTVAFGVLIGMRFNMANIVAVPLILGLGVDSGIHVFMRYREDGNLSEAIDSTTPRAVTLSALTTLAAFSSLSISAHRGMASLGVLLSFSIVALLYCTLVVLPALIEVRERWRKGRAESRS